MMTWEKIDHCSWQTENGERIVKQYKPCKGGVVFTLFDGKQLSYWPTLEKAKEALDDQFLRERHNS